MTDAATPANDRELVLVREIDVPREKIYKAWTTPELMLKFFTPRPWSTSSIEIDLRPGGKFNSVMRDPDGKEYPNKGVVLEAVPNEKLVFTDAFTEGWAPSEKPFFVATITLEDLGSGRTRYTARANHWREEDRKSHEEMGFHEGWGQVVDQLAELCKTMP